MRNKRSVKKGTPDCGNRSMNINEAYENLANAIIVCATDDYAQYSIAIREHKKTIKRSFDSNRIRKIRESIKELSDQMKSIEDFFQSDYFTLLTSVDPEYIIKRLKEEIA